MPMTCDSCGNKEAVRLSYSSKGSTCDQCSNGLPYFKFSDVYFKGEYFDPNLAHPDRSPWGQHIRSREHKSFLMRELGVRESGDKYHGSR